MNVEARSAIEKNLQKAQRKLALCEEVMKYVIETKDAFDPTIEKILVKLFQAKRALISRDPKERKATVEHLEKWRSKLAAILAMNGGYENLNQTNRMQKDLFSFVPHSK